MNDVERAYRLNERRREVPLETRVFRGKVGVLLALQLSALLAGVAFAVDIRRLQTPAGAAQAYAEAFAFGDCARVRQLSVGPPLDCAALEAAAQERARAIAGVQVRTRVVSVQGDRAEAAVEVEEPGGTEVGGLSLVRRDDAWLVVRDG